jgi:hypothetical protein
MDRLVYLTFDMRIEKQGDRYLAQVIYSPAGEASVGFATPFAGMVREQWLDELPKDLGTTLFDAAFGGQVTSCLLRSLDKADQSGQGLRIRLRLADAPELADMPWEYLYDTHHRQFLCLSTNTPIVRYMSLPDPIQALKVKPPLRVLVMISSPTDQPTLDVEHEWTKVTQALGDQATKGLVVLERLEEATLSALQKQLRRGEYHIFHYIGHGAFDERVQDGVLLFENKERRSQRVDGQLLGTLLGDERTLRLAILNACEGARASRTDPFAGTAQSLVRKRIPAVIAMQFEISDEAAKTFVAEFYSALTDGYPVDAALGEARKAVRFQGHKREWGTPVLYMRAPDGHIFDIPSKGPAPAVEQEARTVETPSVAEEPPADEVQEEPATPAALEPVYIKRARPARGGDSIGHYRLDSAATLGCLVVDRDEPDRVFILCDTSGMCPPWARAGDLILQPGPYDGGDPATDVIATLTRWAEIRANPQAAAQNVSASIAQVRNLNDVSPKIHKRGYLRGIRTASPGMPVFGVGRTRGATSGTILRVDTVQELSWPLQQVTGGVYGSSGDGSGYVLVPFADLIETTGMVEAGDSGMILLDADNYVLGLGFAGGAKTSLFLPIQRVLDALNVDLVTEDVWRSIV